MLLPIKLDEIHQKLLKALVGIDLAEAQLSEITQRTALLIAEEVEKRLRAIELTLAEVRTDVKKLTEKD